MKLLILFFNWLKKKKQYFIPAALRKSCLIWTLCAWNAFFHCLILLNYVIARAVQNYQSGMRKSIILLFVCLMFCLVFAYRSVLVLFLFTRMQIEIYQCFSVTTQTIMLLCLYNQLIKWVERNTNKNWRRRKLFPYLICRTISNPMMTEFSAWFNLSALLPFDCDSFLPSSSRPLIQ